MSARQRLFLATGNSHKTREFAQLLGPGFSVRDLSSQPGLPEVVENGETFAENATLKAVSASRFMKEIVVADDSGLEVDALGGAPGIYSARYAGEQATDEENVRKILQAMSGVAVRVARFRCVLAVAQAGNAIRTFPGEVEGVIACERSGGSGFGYDPIFIPAGCDATFAELPPELKNEISHRARAVRSLREYFAAV